MKLPLLFLVAGLGLTHMSPADPPVPISLSAPVGKSLKPDLLYWSFDEGMLNESSPNPITDGSGNGFDGHLLPGRTERPPTYVEGMFGTGLLLYGESKTELDPHVNWNAADTPTGDDTLLDLDGKSFTAGAWVKLKTHTDDAEESFVLFERGRSAAGHSHWSIQIDRRPDGKWSLSVFLPGSYKRIFTNGVPLDDGEWHHIGASFEPAGDTTLVSLWLDGLLLEGNIVLEGVIGPAEAKDQLFTLGERNISYHKSALIAEVDDAFITSGIHPFEP